MAPEYYENGVFSVKSDIYSLGIIIMQIVTGQKDHGNIKSVRTTLSNHLHINGPFTFSLASCHS